MKNLYNLMVDDRQDRQYKYRLSWFIPEDDDIGGSLGDMIYVKEDFKTTDPEDHDCILAYLAAKDTPDVQSDSSGFYWETRAKAAAALRIVKAAIKAGVDARPMPEWATKAIAAGWKAPKGWKP